MTKPDPRVEADALRAQLAEAREESSGWAADALRLESESDALRAQLAEVEAENVRLRELYENVAAIKARGWTIDHLMECEESLRTVEVAASEAVARAETAEADRDTLTEALREMRQWAEVYEDHMGGEDFRRRDEAFARADAALAAVKGREE
jgi:DNA repair exonuclease SbcCD ATPase subunit